MVGGLIGGVHLGAAIAALGTGAVVLLRRKSGPLHRHAGYAYTGAMLLLNLTALMLYRLTGSVNVFHVAALLSLGTVLAGVAVARRRRPNWLEGHFRLMSWSYIGLLAAAVAETATRVVLPLLRARGIDPATGFWLLVAGATAAVCSGGAVLVRTAGVRAAARARRDG